MKCRNCNREAQTDNSFCWYCDPTIEQSLKDAARIRGGALSRRVVPVELTSDTFTPISTRADLKTFLNAVLLDLVILPNSTARGRALADVARVLDSAIVRDEELTALRQQIADLKKLAGVAIIEAESEVLNG